MALAAPCALWLCSARGGARELEWWESCSPLSLIICVAVDVACALPRHAWGNIIFTDGVTFYLPINGNSNFGSFVASESEMKQF